MTASSPVLDPQPGLVLAYSGYSITVTAREGNIVSYTVTGQECKPRQSKQELEAWVKWAPSAKVRRKGVGADECVILKFSYAGHCRVCQKPIERDAHATDEGVTCAKCCTRKVHK